MKLLIVLGWIFVPYIMIVVRWKKIGVVAKSFGCIWAFFALLMVIGSFIPDEPLTAEEIAAQEAKEIAHQAELQKIEDESNAKIAAIEKEKADNEAKLKEKNKNFVLAFEKEIYAQDERFQNYEKGYKIAMDDLSKGKIDINGAYEATAFAHDAAIIARTYTFKIEIEKSLPIDVRELLEGARNELATAYNEKASALQAAMDYLDDQKPSYLQDFKDYNRSSDAFMISSMAKILDAKIKVGIK